MVHRTMSQYLSSMAQKYPVVTVSGPRQSGKTTLVRAVFPDKPYVNLERPDIRDFAVSDPLRFMEKYAGGAVFDEFQNVPELTSYIQVYTDENPGNGRFILTGSRQFEILSSVSQSLAGRTAILKLLPFSIQEMQGVYPDRTADELMFQGFYPRRIDQEIEPSQFYSDYLLTYVERDVRNILGVRNLSLFEKFLRLCAGRTGQLLNLNSLAHDTGINHNTAREWLTVLEASYIIHLVQPWHENAGKRLTKSPKLYFYDTGLASYLLGIEHHRQMETHPLRGNLFENMVVMESLKYFCHHGRQHPFYFYRDSNGVEADMLIPAGGKMAGVEIKSAQTVTPEFWKNLKKLETHLTNIHSQKTVIYGGEETIRRSDAVIFPFRETAAFLDGLLR